MCIFFSGLPFASSEDRARILEDVSKSTHGFVPSDLQNLCTQVLLQVVKQGQSPLVSLTKTILLYGTLYTKMPSSSLRLPFIISRKHLKLYILQA